MTSLNVTLVSVVFPFYFCIYIIIIVSFSSFYSEIERMLHKHFSFTLHHTLKCETLGSVMLEEIEK